MTDLEDLYTDLKADPEATAPGYENCRAAMIKRLPQKLEALQERGRQQAMRASRSSALAGLPYDLKRADPIGIKKFSWETDR